MQNLKNLVTAIVKEEEGQGLVEYSLIIALVSVAAVATMQALSGNINGVFTSIGNTLSAA